MRFCFFFFPRGCFFITFTMLSTPPSLSHKKKGQKASLFETNQGEALTLSWCNVGYTIEVPAKAAGAQARGTAGAKEDAAAGDGKKKKKKKNVDKTILSGINGVVRPGEMVCIMGTSGSGKTSMLNCLSGRHIQGKVTGDILLNGKKRTSLYRRQTAYVEQDDVMFPHLTVRETMYYTARLRMPRGTTYDEKIARADEVMQVLGLSDCKDTRIGSAFFKGTEVYSNTHRYLVLSRGPCWVCNTHVHAHARTHAHPCMHPGTPYRGCSSQSASQPASSILSGRQQAKLVIY